MTAQYRMKQSLTKSKACLPFIFHLIAKHMQGYLLILHYMETSSKPNKRIEKNFLENLGNVNAKKYILPIYDDLIIMKMKCVNISINQQTMTSKSWIDLKLIKLIM